MHQVLQNIRNGKLTVAQVPEPMARPGQVLIANTRSLISAGTEKMVMDLARKSLLGKARERPDHVRRVLEKLRQEGFFTTLRQVMGKLDEPLPMGYSSAGVVLACGAGVQEFKPGQRVASNGPHAGIVCVPRHLCALVGERVSDDQAAFAVLGAIALQGVRLSRLQLGETAFVIGLGLVGQLTVALLKAAGVRVICTDLEESKCTLALRMGADVARSRIAGDDVTQCTHGLGADAVLVTASSNSDEPIALAADAVRQKGRVVAVGAVGMNLPRRPFYFKEAELVVSCSYGPGRYDPQYEEQGHDYPAGHVRWTEQRNMQAVLDLMAAGRLDVSPLISHRFSIEKAEEAYRLLDGGREPYLGVLLEYPEVNPERLSRRIEFRATAMSEDAPGVGVLGAGNFARLTLLPAIKECGAYRLISLCSAGGVSAAQAGEKLGFENAVTDEAQVLSDSRIQAVFILTRHDQHARQVVEAIKRGKHVFVEKPLCLTVEELQQIEAALLETKGERLLMVGFNRRFSPAARQVREFFAETQAPLTVSVRFNAGRIPESHWTQDEAAGGGRIVGEACHAIDLATFLTGSVPVRVFCESVGGAPGAVSDDQCFITLRHANGSVSSIAYLAGGDKAFPKERVEVIGGGGVAVIEDFREVQLCHGGKVRTNRRWAQEKGYAGEIEAFAKALRQGGPAPIRWEELRAVSLAAILAVRSLREGVPFDL
jgi:predicted dehydrogenase/threonine dehydrogenase-like Zn-dependent dehydrogenase